MIDKNMKRLGKISLAVAGVLGLLLLLIGWLLSRSTLEPQPCVYGPPVADYKGPAVEVENNLQAGESDSLQDAGQNE